MVSKPMGFRLRFSQENQSNDSKTLYLMVKTMVSCRFSLKSNDSWTPRRVVLLLPHIFPKEMLVQSLEAQLAQSKKDQEKLGLGARKNRRFLGESSGDFIYGENLRFLGESSEIPLWKSSSLIGTS